MLNIGWKQVLKYQFVPQMSTQDGSDKTGSTTV